jgi:hypothetical protein
VLFEPDRLPYVLLAYAAAAEEANLREPLKIGWGVYQWRCEDTSKPCSARDAGLGTALVHRGAPATATGD